MSFDYDISELNGYMTGGGPGGANSIGIIFHFLRDVGIAIAPVALVIMIITTFVQRGDEKAVKKNIQIMIIIIILYAILRFAFNTPGEVIESITTW